MTKKKKRESWKEKQRRIALKHQKALEAQRIQRSKAPKKKATGFPKGKLVTIAVFLLLIVSIYFVWSATQPASNQNNQQNQQPQNPQPKKAPAFTLTDIDGDTFSLSTFEGKIVLLDLFGTDCPACTEFIPELKEVYKKYPGNEVEIVSVSVQSWNTEQSLKEYRVKHKIEWRIARDTDNLAMKYNVRFIPKIVVIDKEGAIRFEREGVVSSETLCHVIEPLRGK